MRNLSLLLLLLPTLAFAQTPVWVKVATESTQGVVTLPAGTTYRYGTSTGVTNTGVDCSKASCWFTATVPSGGAIFSTLFWPSGQIAPQADPAPGLLKELDIAQTTVEQTITIAGKPVTVAASIPPSTTYTVTNCPATFSGTVTTSGTTNTLIGTVTLSPGCTAVKQ